MALGNVKLYRKLASMKMYTQNNFCTSPKLHWFKSYNFGDALNPILFKFITGVKPVWIASEFYKKENYSMIGSILQVVNEQTVVWGSGFISQNDKFHYGKPKKVLAVRGPKTREKLLELGVDCPEVYGDPALLLPKYYTPNVIKKYKLGVIPHYVNKSDSNLIKLHNNPEVLIINVMNPNTLQVIDQINSCESIISSSLHGIIISDAYKIPSQWIKFKQSVGRDDFKFYDYGESVNKNMEPYYIQENTNFMSITINRTSHIIDFDDNTLLKNCPFN